MGDFVSWSGVMEATIDFPFVETLPKRKKGRLAKAWDEFDELRAVCGDRGLPLLIGHAAILLGVSVQRVQQLIYDGRFQPVIFQGRRYICEDDILAWARSERKHGRPGLSEGSALDVFRAVKAQLKQG